MAWRNCKASIALVDELNRRWPARDRASDGTIGDAAHASRSSDHNPWVVVDGVGVVRARDIDKDGIDAPWLCEHLRQLGARGDPRLTGGGYLIFNRRITTPDWRGWKTYTGSNPHTAHVHVSFSRDRAGFDSTAGWGLHPIGGAPPSPTPRPAPEDDMTPEQERLLREVHAHLSNRHPSRADYRLLGEATPGQPYTDTIGGYAVNADARSYETRQLVIALVRRVDELSERLRAQPADANGVDPQTLAATVADELAARLREP